MQDNFQAYNPNIADLLYGSFIKYDRMYEMTKFALYGATDVRDINIFIDAYSILRSLYRQGSNISVKDSCVIASSLINLAIHLRAYFETRHKTTSKVYIVYGGARPKEAFVNYYRYNEKNIFMENSNIMLSNLIDDNLNMIKVLTPYLYDIFYVIDKENEFSVIVSSIINKNKEDKSPNLIYSKDDLAYQLVAFKPRTFLYRPKKRMQEDVSWVATKSTLYNAYRYGELGVKKQIETILDFRMFSIFQAVSGVRDRSMNALKNANNAIKLLENAVASNIFSNGYNANAIFFMEPNPFCLLENIKGITGAEVTNRFAAIDLNYQTMLFENSIASMDMTAGLINLYNPDEVRYINNRYFQEYPLDLNRV